jgi:hypothetical protein
MQPATKLYVNAITTTNDTKGIINITGNNSEIHANIGAEFKTFQAVILDGAAPITVKLMEGKSIFVDAVAGGVALSGGANSNNILELYNNSAIIGAVSTNSNGRYYLCTR